VRANPVYLSGIALDAGIEAAFDLAALAICDVVLLVCPAQAVRVIARDLPGKSPVVICAKGIEASSGLLMPEVLAEVLPGRPIALLSGPSFAEEAVKGPADGGQHRYVGCGSGPRSCVDARSRCVSALLDQ